MRPLLRRGDTGLAKQPPHRHPSTALCGSRLRVAQGAGCVHVGLPRHRARRRETLVDIPPACGPGVAHCRRWTRHRHDSLNESSSLAELPVTRAAGRFWSQEPCVARDSGRSSKDHRPDNRHTPGTNRPSRTRPIDRAKQRNRLSACVDVRPRRSSSVATPRTPTTLPSPLQSKSSKNSAARACRTPHKGHRPPEVPIK